MTRSASDSIGLARTDWGLSMLRWGGPVALLELACEVSLRREATAQRDVTDGAGGMARIGELPVRQCEAFLPDPLRYAAFVIFEHSVEIAQRHCHVVCDGFSVEFAFRKMFSDETFSPQKTKSHDVVASWSVMPPRLQELQHPGANLVMHGRRQKRQRLVYETKDAVPERLDEQLSRAKVAIDLEQSGLRYLVAGVQHFICLDVDHQLAHRPREAVQIWLLRAVDDEVAAVNEGAVA